jgi:hypothetical protein
MKRNRIYLICLAVIVIAGLTAVKLSAFPDASPKESPLLEGQIFKILIRPAGKQLEVFVTGKRALDVEMSEVGLTAKVHMGDKVIVIPTSRVADRFTLEALPRGTAGSKLRIRVQQGDLSEDFEYQTLPVRP